MRSVTAKAAYRKSSSLRTLREQEADIFRTVNAALRHAPSTGPLAVAKAVSDNELLWIALMDLMRDPSNQLPPPTRAAILSVGHSVRRECAAAAPDFAFMININQQIATGLFGNPYPTQTQIPANYSS